MCLRGLKLRKLTVCTLWMTHKYFDALKEHLVRKEKNNTPPYCKEVSKKQTLKGPAVSLFKFYCRNSRTLNACITKDFNSKLRISNQKNFLCWILILLEGKYCGIMYLIIVLFVLNSFFQNQKSICPTEVVV